MLPCVMFVVVVVVVVVAAAAAAAAAAVYAIFVRDLAVAIKIPCVENAEISNILSF